jgi:hypothetical protein
MGRVNSVKRIAYATEIGCDSIDGTGWVCWRNIRLPEGLQAVSAPPRRALPGFDRDATRELPYRERQARAIASRAAAVSTHQQLVLWEFQPGAA